MKKENKRISPMLLASAGICFPVCLTLGIYMIFIGSLTGSGGISGTILIAAAIAVFPLLNRRVLQKDELKIGRFVINGRKVILAILVLALVAMYGGFLYNMYLSHRGSEVQLIGSSFNFFTEFSLAFKVLGPIGLLIILMLNAMNSKDTE